MSAEGIKVLVVIVFIVIWIWAVNRRFDQILEEKYFKDEDKTEPLNGEN